jgi:hypothetical protein
MPHATPGYVVSYHVPPTCGFFLKSVNSYDLGVSALSILYARHSPEAGAGASHLARFGVVLIQNLILAVHMAGWAVVHLGNAIDAVEAVGRLRGRFGLETLQEEVPLLFEKRV